MICGAIDKQLQPSISTDDAGGAIIAWSDDRNGGASSRDVYAQRVNGSGNVQWAANGVAVCTATADQANPRIVSDGAGGVILAWSDGRPLGTGYNVFAQRLNATGVAQWTADGVGICTAAGNQNVGNAITLDGSGGAIIGWLDQRSSSNGQVYAQRVDASGAPLWTSDGVAVSTAANLNQNSSQVLVGDGLGGAIVAWGDRRNGSNYDVYAQRVSASGVTEWEPGGVPISVAPGDQSFVGLFVPNYLPIVTDGFGGAIVAWSDGRIVNTGDTVFQQDWQVFAQQINNAGLIGTSPAPEVFSVSPANGGNAGSVSVSVVGRNMASAATLKLSRAAHPDIIGTSASVTIDGTSMTAICDLAAAAVGAWDVVVMNPDAQTARLVGGFTVALIQGPQLTIRLIGRDLIRGNRRTAYDVVIENPGNVDAGSVPVWLTGIPLDASVDLDFPLSYPPRDAGEPDWSTVPLGFTSPRGRYVPLVIPRVPPGTTVRRINVTVPPTDPSFVLGLATTPPWADGNKFRSCLSAVVSAPACMGAQLTAINAYIAGHPEVEALSGVGVWAKEAWNCEGSSTLPGALTKAEQVLDYMVGVVESPSSTTTACSDVLPPRWRDSLLVTVVSSYDPNDKLGAQGTLPLQQAIPYSIRFENASNATAPAQQVVVSDALNTVTLDPNTVSLDAITFGSVRIVPPPGLSSYATTVDLRPAMPLLVQVSAVVDKLTGVVSWNFTSIDPVTGAMPTNPLVGFLPPAGEGSVLFTVLPRPGLAGGTQITNAASIMFDENAPNTTPMWINTVDNTPPSSAVLPLPGNSDLPSVPVSWTAQGAPADLRDFTVYVKEDAGTYRVWRLNTTSNTDTLVPPKDHKLHTYAFYSVARDVNGNIEAPPSGPDATTLARTDVTGAEAWGLGLEGARPNPVVRATGLRVWFTLPNREAAELEMLDIAGREIWRRDVGTLGRSPRTRHRCPRPTETGALLHTARPERTGTPLARGRDRRVSRSRRVGSGLRGALSDGVDVVERPSLQTRISVNAIHPRATVMMTEPRTWLARRSCSWPSLPVSVIKYSQSWNPYGVLSPVLPPRSGSSPVPASSM